ncbi:leucine-rich repeat domain-containing protein [Legionella sp. km772]|uniref:leucine-rich repeat domain-containing protein n=1 Tax=Legionella sp. km772 TaxID=2498111 RepID=UPI000F8D3251|nr:leucine-rich repeat domain-containing protein [Legionella sp. km772]RUR12960.1 leucine-rich repeat domain-containing protein [Legionella sp. km772]
MNIVFNEQFEFILSEVNNEDIENGIFSFPPAITTIGDDAFARCTNLIRITIPEHITDMGDNVFSDATNLEECNVHSVLTNIKENTFWNCERLQRFIIPSSVIQIEDQAFMNCISLEAIEIPDGVTEIGRFVFSDCVLLADVKLSKNLTTISEGLFQRCHSLTSITLSENLKYIETVAFDECTALENLVIPKTVVSIGEGAFASCQSLTSIIIPSEVKIIDRNTFANCTKLKEVILPENIQEVGEEAFQGCEQLTRIIIDTECPQHLERIKLLFSPELSEKVLAKGLTRLRLKMLEKFSTECIDKHLRLKFSPDISRYVMSYVEREEERKLQQELESVPIDVNHYETRLCEIQKKHIDAFKRKEAIEFLTNYLALVNKIKLEQRAQNPDGFFFSKKLKSAKEQFASTLERIIKDLKANKAPLLSQDEREILNTKKFLSLKLSSFIQTGLGLTPKESLLQIKIANCTN